MDFLFPVDWHRLLVPHLSLLEILIRDGSVLRANLRAELMTEAQLLSKLRCSGIRTPAVVAEAWLEGDGHASVVRANAPQADSAWERRPD